VGDHRHLRRALHDLQVEGGLTGVGLAHHLPAADLLQQRAQDPADGRVVVDEQDPAGAAGPSDGGLDGLYRLAGIANEPRSARLFP
jgi:hypothetical protein